MARALAGGVRGLVCLAVVLLLAACLPEQHRSLAPLPKKTKAELAASNIDVAASLFVRVFKAESQMEVWLENRAGEYTLFRTYPICKWAGDLGPKTREGDNQAPEGFYVVNARHMNPDSKYYLSFNLGYPNAYDLSHGYTGSALMVHGGCRSAGCYAITDAQIKELFILAREAFTVGQRDFPVHAFPFRMTAENLAARTGSQWEAFWANLKEGYDVFETTRRPPIAGVKDGRYVFFDAPENVPEEFRLEAASASLQAPRLISGWGS